MEQRFDPASTVVGTHTRSLALSLTSLLRGVIGPRFEMLRRARPVGADWT